MYPTTLIGKLKNFKDDKNLLERLKNVIFLLIQSFIIAYLFILEISNPLFEFLFSRFFLVSFLIYFLVLLISFFAKYILKNKSIHLKLIFLKLLKLAIFSLIFFIALYCLNLNSFMQHSPNFKPTEQQVISDFKVNKKYFIKMVSLIKENKTPSQDLNNLMGKIHIFRFRDQSDCENKTEYVFTRYSSNSGNTIDIIYSPFDYLCVNKSTRKYPEYLKIDKDWYLDEFAR